MAEAPYLLFFSVQVGLRKVVVLLFFAPKVGTVLASVRLVHLSLGAEHTQHPWLVHGPVHVVVKPSSREEEGRSRSGGNGGYKVLPCSSEQWLFGALGREVTTNGTLIAGEDQLP